MTSFRITPNAHEKVMQEGDLIVSKTDVKGRITYGNRIFHDYSGFTEMELLGKQHIRHPDMPRAVFKLLWDHLELGQEVFAFVKNISKDGSFYWVFANITPSYDAQGTLLGYFSVRRKPNPKAVAIYRGSDLPSNAAGRAQHRHTRCHRCLHPLIDPHPVCQPKNL